MVGSARAGQQPGISAAALPVRLVDNEAMPLYLQVVHQVKHLILTEELADGVLLPAVRPLAAHLGINPGTVVQAYRQLAAEGLIEAVRGRGSVVRSLSGRSSDTVGRERLLDAAIARLVARSRALGVPETQTLQRVSAALLDARKGVPIVFFGQSTSQAQRFAAHLDARFEPENIHFRPLSLEQAQDEGAGALIAELEIAYTVVTFATLVPDVERLLDEHALEAEIIGVRAELTPTSLETLEGLAERGRCVVITEPHAVSSVLAQIEREAGLDRHLVHVVPRAEDGELDQDELRAAVESGDVIVYTSGVTTVIDSLALPPERLAELGFQLTTATLRDLDRRWTAGEQS